MGLSMTQTRVKHMQGAWLGATMQDAVQCKTGCEVVVHAWGGGVWWCKVWH